ncbi:MAG: GNAT family N-acetyltransferase [Actinomycetota bacterium]
MERPYPEHWEADVVLRDGATAHVRPIRPDDAAGLVAFYAGVSEESKYLRFFAPYPTLSDRDVAWFTTVDYDERVALVAVLGEGIVGVVRYDRVAPDGRGPGRGSPLAEVAFLVQDAHQGRGLGSVLLEHIAEAARERGVRRFVAEVLPGNRRMLAVFQQAGFTVTRAFEEGVVRLTLALEPTASSVAVAQAREHRAESRSVARLLHPRSVAVVGASREPGSVGQALLRHLLDAGFTGPVYAVNPAAADAGAQVAGQPAYPSLDEVPGEVDLVVVAVPAAQGEVIEEVVTAAGRRGAHGLLVVSSGFAETGPLGRERQVRLVATARRYGMRVIGPNSFGVLNSDPGVRLNASLAPVLPGPGRVGFFSQSGALGIALLEQVVRRGLGLSTFVSAGNRADVSGNDLLQYWEEDPATDVVLLYLESIGNPRKFSRLARRIGRRTPIVAVKGGRSTQGVPVGHAVRVSELPPAAVDALFDQAGVVRVDTLAELFDVAALLTLQPLPAGPAVGVVGNSDALALLVADAAAGSGLRLAGPPVTLPAAADAGSFAAALAGALADPGVDSVVVVYVPPVAGGGAPVARAVAAAAVAHPKTVVSTFLPGEEVLAGLRTLDRHGTPVRGSVPTYPTPEEAVRALAAVTAYAAWRHRPPGTSPDLAGVDVARGRAVVSAALTPEAAPLPRAQLAELLAAFGIRLAPSVVVANAAQAVAAADQLGYPVVLKTLARGLRHRTDLGGVRLGIASAADLRAEYAALVARVREAVQSAGAGEDAETCVVQPMAGPGVAVTVGSAEDPAFGPVVSFGLAGLATELLGDRAWRIPPLTDVDAAELVRAVRAAPLLLGYRGAEPVDVPALEELLLRVSRLAEEIPELARLQLDPVVVGRDGLVVVDATGRLAPPRVRTDLPGRRLTPP